MSEDRVWDRLAGRYDLVVRLFDTSYGRVRHRHQRDLAGGERVLEIAAGTGQFTPELACAADRVVATDVSSAMVERLRERVVQQALDNVECAVMNAYNLDAPDASFDVVFCANALHVMEEPARALSQFRRVLRHDGLLVSPTFLHGADRLRRALSRSLSLVSPFVAHTRFDVESLTQLVVDAGFDVELVETMPGLFPLAYVLARSSTRTSEPATTR